MTKQKLDRNAFKAKVGPSAQRMQDATGIPAEFAIAQAADESNYGGSQLAALYNNYFGIKDLVRATVPRGVVSLPTKEFLNGQYVTVDAKFATYKTIDDCFMDWGNYILRKYPAAAAAAKRRDAAGFFAELQRGGYATNPQYAADLTNFYKELYA